MAVLLASCDEDAALWDEYFLILMRNYKELSLPYDFEMTFSFIGNPIISGNAIVAMDLDTRQPVAALGYVYGTGADYYEDTSLCQVEAVYIAPAYRRTTLFYQLLRKFAGKLDSYETETIQFWSPADRADLRGLFSLISTHVLTNDKDFGSIDLFETKVSQLQAFCAKRSDSLG